MEQKHISRRTFLKVAGTGLAASAIAACAPAGTQSTTGSAPAATGNKEFVMWGLQYDPHVDRYHALADAFFKKTEN